MAGVKVFHALKIQIKPKKNNNNFTGKDLKQA